MQPQSKSANRARVATIAIPAQRIVGTRSTIACIRTIRIWPTLCEWARRWRARRELRAMSQREIADFCAKLTDALREAEKPFWRP
jgi:uncharacterized protein YjiS (DUF1127 family)